MSLRLLGKKLGMTQVFDDNGMLQPVTVIELGPNFVVQKKTEENDGYSAIQVGFQLMREKNSTKGRIGHTKNVGLEPLRFLRESRLTTKEVEQYNPGDNISIDYFTEGEYVDVVGTSKGRGFAGVMKRHGMHGTASLTHGAHEAMRHAGSIGASATPARVFKGKKMPGRMGNDRKTVQNLKVVAIRPDENLIIVKGAIPGARGGLVMVAKSVKRQG
jgi:large subunit ribosomal protein L3